MLSPHWLSSLLSCLFDRQHTHTRPSTLHLLYCTAFHNSQCNIQSSPSPTISIRFFRIPHFVRPSQVVRGAFPLKANSQLSALEGGLLRLEVGIVDTTPTKLLGIETKPVKAYFERFGSSKYGHGSKQWYPSEHQKGW